jgi:hypothetical protein
MCRYGSILDFHQGGAVNHASEILGLVGAVNLRRGGAVDVKGDS